MSERFKGDTAKRATVWVNPVCTSMISGSNLYQNGKQKCFMPFTICFESLSWAQSLVIGIKYGIESYPSSMSGALDD